MLVAQQLVKLLLVSITLYTTSIYFQKTLLDILCLLIKIILGSDVCKYQIFEANH